MLNALDLFPGQAAREQLAASDLASFDALWSLAGDWHEAPNERRGGWSGVSRHLLRDGSAVFLKRQDRHLCRTLRHPLRGVPTFYREYLNILRLGRSRIGTLEPLYYGHRRLGEHWQAVLVTRALDDHVSLDEWNAADTGSGKSAQRRSLISAVAQACARLHHHRLQHGCLYGKHIFVRRAPASRDSYQEHEVRFIDLEKMRQGISRRRVSGRDTDQLMRRVAGWSDDDRSVFRLVYWQRREYLLR